MIKLLKDKRPAFNPVEVRSSYQPRSSLIGRKSIKIGFDLSCAFACPTHSLNSIHISECHRFVCAVMPRFEQRENIGCV